MEIIINDRRGMNPAKVVEPVAAPEPAKPVVAHEWRDKEYILVMTVMQGQQIPVGRAMGIRDDDEFFIADYWLTPRWPVGLDWVKEADKRLNTFLKCSCGNMSVCSDHKHNIGLWQEADMQRMGYIGGQPLGEVLERFMRIEQARQANQIVVPR